MGQSHDVRVERSDDVALRSGEDVVRLRQAVRERAVAVGLTLVDQTKIVTAASELGRNTVQYGGGGSARIAIVANGTRRGVRLEFTDQGPGIADIQQALKDGFTTGSGLGLGLSGARRLSDEFEIESEPGKGTRVVILRWKAY
jgi:serine/threonine-protein kinase RsbT